jgi:hypothetical protein
MAIRSPDAELAAVLGEADALRQRTGAEEVHLRHLLAAAVQPGPSGIDDALLHTLGTTLPDLRRILREAVAQHVPDDPSDSWDAILADEPADAFDLAGDQASDLVDPTQPIDMSRDHLGVGTYVKMLARVIVDERTPMPLSIGLFGEWGSGKSYFMGLLRGEILQLAGGGGEHADRKIRQIGFNAWSYSDANLWASLGHELWQQLAGVPRQELERRDELRAEHARAVSEGEALASRSQEAEARIAQLQSAIDRASTERPPTAAELIGAASAEVRAQLGASFSGLGIEDPTRQAELVEQELAGTADELTVLRQLRRERLGWLTAGLAAVVVVLVVLVPLIQPQLARWLAAIGVPTLVGLVVTARAALRRAHQGLTAFRRSVADLRTSADPLAEQRASALDAAKADAEALATQQADVGVRIESITRQLELLTPDALFEERALSDDYRRHLGLISTLRRDLNNLIVRLKQAEGDDRVDRIVLYIDDLDRCTPRQVVAVLQAVHLLLALELFVVVVGVDPRWLVRSLRSQYAKLLASEGDDGDDWQASPHDYLEKIFNIPFSLPRMTSASFGTLLRSFADERSDVKVAPPPAPDAENSPDVTHRRVVTASVAGGAAAAAADAVAGAAPLEAQAGSAIATSREERGLTGDEVKLLAQLGPLVASPREAKRLLNVYRMVRATRDLSTVSEFLGNGSVAGEYQAVAILLGMLSGHAALMPELLAAPASDSALGGILGRSASTTWSEFAAGIAPRQSAGGGWENDVVGPIPIGRVVRWQNLATSLAPAAEAVSLSDLAGLRKWAPQVARFSFVLSPYVAERPGGGAST